MLFPWVHHRRIYTWLLERILHLKAAQWPLRAHPEIREHSRDAAW